jgi:hypothetical protein
MKVDDLLDMQAEKEASTDLMVEGLLPDIERYTAELLMNPEERDAELWESEGIDPNLKFQDLMLTPISQRDAVWRDLLASMIAMAEHQAFLVYVAPGLLEKAEKDGNEIQRFSNSMSKAELKTAAIIGVSKKLIKEKKNGRAANQA